MSIMNTIPFFSMFGCFLGMLLIAQTNSLDAQTVDEARQLTDAECVALLTAAEAMQKGFENGDADVIIQGTCKVITKLIPEGQFETITKQAMASMKEIKFESNAYGEPTECWKLKEGELCFLPRKSVMVAKGRRISSLAFFICVLEGGKWSFLDNASVSKQPELLWRLFPELSKNVKLPPSEMKLLD